VRERSQTPWLTNFKEKPDARFTLFCFPYAGGNASMFRLWQSELLREIQLASVQPPGRGDRLSEPAFKHLPEMVQELGPALLPFFNKPFAFFGHSMGALILFELTRWLRRAEKPMPTHLYVSGRPAPQLPDDEPPNRDLPEPQFIARLQELQGTPQEVLDHPELMQLMIPLLRADFSVCETYEYQDEAPLNCPITVFGGLGDIEVPREELEPWRVQTTSSFSLKMLAGDHFFVHSAKTDLIRVINRDVASNL